MVLVRPFLSVVFSETVSDVDTLGTCLLSEGLGIWKSQRKGSSWDAEGRQIEHYVRH